MRWQAALAVSLLAHAALLSLKFVDPQPPAAGPDASPLEIVLVNASDEQAPQRARLIAQADLDGGGSGAAGRAASPLVASPVWQSGDAEEAPAGRQGQPGQALLTRLSPGADALHSPEQLEGEAGSADAQRRQQALARVLGEVEQRLSQDTDGPRRRYIGPATREAVYARYYGELRRRIEERGTAEFPQAGGRRLFGDLTMLITVDSEGRVLAAELLQGSGDARLDRRAEQIVRGLSFDRFDAALRERADQVVVASRFRFLPEGDRR